MKNPSLWFKKAVECGEYSFDVINEMESCISNDGFNYNKFINWVSKRIDEE